MIHSLTAKLAAVTTAVFGLLLLAAGSAAALVAPPDPGGRETSEPVPAAGSVQGAVSGSLDTTQWVAIAAVAVIALVVGAVVMGLVLRHAHRAQVA